MEIKNLQTFIQVAELNSFTKAARALNYSQSTVSFQIMQLEKEFDCLLFERINNTLKLTDRGKDLLEYAKKLYQLMEAFEQDIRNEQTVSGVVRVITSDSIAESMMYNNYIEFNSMYPDISLRLSTADTNHMFEMLDRNEADIVLTLDQHVYRNDYRIVREEKVKTHFVAGAHSALAGQEIVTLDELLKNPFYLTEKGMGYRAVMDDFLARRSVEIQPVLEISRTDIITDLLEKGNGISFLPDFVTEEKVRKGTIKRLNVPEIRFDIWKQMIHHKKKWISRALEAFIQFAIGHEFTAE